MIPKTIVVVGGGTAGWLTANILNGRLNSPGKRMANVTLIESKDIPRVGVGEATVPLLKETLLRLGIDEFEFMRRTHATFKHAIRYNNWQFNPTSGRPDYYYHPFENFNAPRKTSARRYYGQIDALMHLSQNDVTNYWWHRQRAGRAEAFAYEIGVQPYLCDTLRSPKTAGMPPYQSDIPYAYHLDAQLFADYLAEVGVELGITHLVDDVISCSMTEKGAIDSVRTREHGDFPADFFIDCTGFSSLLIGKALDVPFVEYGQHLLCDRAIAIPTAPAPANPRPYTSATAADAGWIWEIDLTSRSGNGYVYSSSFTSDDEAERYLRKFLGNRADGVETVKLRMRTGRRKELWRKNCVAIGLSGGFVEPLESTGIMFVDIAARWLAELFPFNGEFSQASARYNSIMVSQYEEIRDFIALHYCLTRRDDTPFWLEVRKPERIPESLREQLELWRHAMPNALHLRDLLQIYDHRNYECILFGMGWEPNVNIGRQGLCEPSNPDQMIRLVQASAQKAIADLPLHADILENIKHTRNLKGVNPQSATSTHGVLEHGIALTGLATEPRRIRLSVGTCTVAEAGLDQSNYKPEARVPKEPWRSPNQDELTLLTNARSISGPGSFVSVFRLEVELFGKFRAIGEEAAAIKLFHDRPMFDGVKERSIELLVRQLGMSYSEPNSIYRGEGVTVNKPGTATTTHDLTDGLLPGLHLDNWSALSPVRRDESYNRMCVNIGTEIRQFLFVNLSVRSMIQMISEFQPNIANEHPTKIGRMFMMHFPDYPVVSVDVAPGEGYIAPTENLIHDGATVNMKNPDVILTVIGRFGPVPLRMLTRQAIPPEPGQTKSDFDFTALFAGRPDVVKRG